MKVSLNLFWVIWNSRPLIFGDKNHLMKALSNLMSNAVKFSDQGKHVELSVPVKTIAFRSR